jgi:hypothetical protein
LRTDAAAKRTTTATAAVNVPACASALPGVTPIDTITAAANATHV